MFFVALAGISLLGEVNRVVTRLITRGVVVLRLLDSGLRICSRIGVSRSAYNESYPEPDGRSGTHVPINMSLGLTPGRELISWTTRHMSLSPSYSIRRAFDF